MANANPRDLFILFQSLVTVDAVILDQEVGARPIERLLAAAVMVHSLVLLVLVVLLPCTISQFDFGLNVGNEACSMAVYEQRVVRGELPCDEGSRLCARGTRADTPRAWAGRGAGGLLRRGLQRRPAPGVQHRLRRAPPLVPPTHGAGQPAHALNAVGLNNAAGAEPPRWPLRR